jgi:GR25 family glycosyltransferase involved in LPS biosynthesis
MCYSFIFLKEKPGLYDDFLDCVYVITMENSFERHKNIEEQFKKYNLCKNTIVVKNKGYKCEKILEIKGKNIKVDDTQTDLTHANITILKHSISQKYKNILILEDDFILSDIICETTHIENIKSEVNKNGNQIISLGCLPYISNNFNDNFKKNFASLGTHAQIYTISTTINLLNYINNNLSKTIFDWDIITSLCGRIFYNKPLVYQIWPETENRNNWLSKIKSIDTKNIKKIEKIYFTCFEILSLDKTPEPGTSILYKMHVKL